MADSNSSNVRSEVTVDEIMAKIKEEVVRKRQELPANSLMDSPLLPRPASKYSSRSGIAVNPASIRVLISAAESHADAGSKVSSMEQFTGIIRVAARAVGKVVVLLIKFITDKQRVFNSMVISSLRAITDSHERLSKNCAAEFDRIQAHYDAQIDELTRKEAENRITILGQRRSLTILLEQTANILQPVSRMEQIKSINDEADHLLDDLYVVYENHFRGSREEVKERLRVYLPYLERLSADKNCLLIDIGCGRGEWLELLHENGYLGKGTDRNRSMVDFCKTLGLDVVSDDALVFLRNLEPGSVTAITGFHFLERLPINIVVALLDESLRVLCPGGMIIFETPNPENVVVGSCNFYTDVARINPLPPAATCFIAEQRGFTNIEILRLHRVKEPEYTGHEHVDELLRRFNCEQDYAVIAYKAE